MDSWLTKNSIISNGAPGTTGSGGIFPTIKADERFTRTHYRASSVRALHVISPQLVSHSGFTPAENKETMGALNPGGS
jgi:hypothetical protein